MALPKEIERKYHVNVNEWESPDGPSIFSSTYIRQGYLFNIKNHTGRIRATLSDTGKRGAKFTYKGPTIGISRTEVEFKIPYFIGNFILAMKKKVIRKRRHLISITNTGLTAEVDHFHNVRGVHLLAEVELPSEDTTFDKPTWLGEEVKDYSEYSNINLVEKVMS